MTKKKYGPENIKYDPIQKPYYWNETHWTEKIPAWAIWLGLGMVSILIMTFAAIGVFATIKHFFG